METSGLTKAQIISAVTTLSPHGNLLQYVDAHLGIAVGEDPEFFAHLIAWNHLKGEIRDSQCALPILQLAVSSNRPVGVVPPFSENALAHLADLNPKLLVRALDFGKSVHAPKNVVYRFVQRYLRDLEGNRQEFDRVALQHRQSLRRLYTLYHVKPAAFAQASVVSGHSVEGTFGVVRQLPSMSPLEIVAAVDKHKLPWLIVRGALGTRATEPDVLMAILGRMTAADLATSAKWLVKAGVKDHPHTRAAFEALLVKAGKPRKAKGTTLKAGKAAKVLQDLGEEKTAGKLKAVQDKQLEQLRTIEGNWLIIGDKSGSMSAAIEATKQVAGILAQSVKGKVYLVFADTAPRAVGDVSGKTLAAIEMTTAAVVANGGTSLGCALEYAIEQGWEIDGLTIVTDGAENTNPTLSSQMLRYKEKFGQVPTVYWYRTPMDRDPRSRGWIRQFENWMSQAGASMTQFDLQKGMDSYSLPNLVQTMRTGKYSLLDEIMSMRLRGIDEVLDRTTGMKVL